MIFYVQEYILLNGSSRETGAVGRAGTFAILGLKSMHPRFGSKFAFLIQAVL